MTSSSIIMRSYRGELDLQLVIDLFDACERVDKLEFSISLDRLRLELENPSVDRDRDLALWEDTQGQLIGFGQLDILEVTKDNLADGNLWFFVHPTARNGDLDRQIVTWAEHRIQEVGRERQGQPKLFTWSRNTRIERIATIEQHGFAESRQFWFLSQSLDRTIPAPQLPAGFTIRHVNAAQEAQAWVDLRNQCFFGSWNYHPLTVENYQLRLQDAEYIPELDLVAISQREGFANDRW
jgi:mycothiol synthase